MSRYNSALTRISIAMLPAIIAVGSAGAQLRPPPSRGATSVQLPAVKALTASAKSVSLAAGTAVSANVTGGQEVTLRVELTAPAPCVERCGGRTVDGQPSGYMRVMLSGDNPAQFALQQMFVRTGQVSGEVNFLTTPVSTPTQLTVSAWTDGSAAQRARLSVSPPVMISFALAEADVTAGASVKGIVRFSGPPASATAVRFQLQTTNGQAVGVPASVTLEPGKTAAEFDVQALGVVQDRNAHVVAFYLDKTLPAPLTVRAAKLTIFENEWPCCDNPFKIGLNGAPPPQGAVIQLTSANPQRIVVPSTLTIPAGQTSIIHTAQSIPGNGDDRVRVTATYNGVSKNWSVLSRKIVKPDLVIRDIVFTDQYSNAITAVADGQPIRMCAIVRAQREGEMNPNLDAPPSVLRVEYQSSTGTGTSSGRTIDYPIAFVRDVNRQYPPISVCTPLPGLTQGNQFDITLTADLRNEVDESREGNNVERVKIARP
ncbi:MAG: hypothetical protein ACT4OZ_10070 [Gemmatimonadota bacterium]